jgi:transposase
VRSCWGLNTVAEGWYIPVIEARLWVARTGRSWRDPDPGSGNWHATYVRFSRGDKIGVWRRIIAAISDDAVLEALLTDSTGVLPDEHAAGAEEKAPSARAACVRIVCATSRPGPFGRGRRSLG